MIIIIIIIIIITTTTNPRLYSPCLPSPLYFKYPKAATVLGPKASPL